MASAYAPSLGRHGVKSWRFTHIVVPGSKRYLKLVGFQYMSCCGCSSFSRSPQLNSDAFPASNCAQRSLHFACSRDNSENCGGDSGAGVPHNLDRPGTEICSCCIFANVHDEVTLADEINTLPVIFWVVSHVAYFRNTRSTIYTTILVARGGIAR